MIFTQIQIYVILTISKFTISLFFFSFHFMALHDFHSDTHLRQCLNFNLLLIILILKILPSFSFFSKQLNLSLFFFYEALFHTKFTITYLKRGCLSKALRNKPIYQLTTLISLTQILITNFTYFGLGTYIFSRKLIRKSDVNRSQTISSSPLKSQ